MKHQRLVTIALTVGFVLFQTMSASNVNYPKHRTSFKKIAENAYRVIPTSENVRASVDCGNTAAIPFAHEDITVSNTAKILTNSVYNPTDPPKASEVLICVNTNSIRAWFDGTAPTSSAGVLLSAGQCIVVCGQTMARVQMIRVSSDSNVSAQYSTLQQ